MKFRELTESEKTDVKQMYNSRWFKVMENLLEDFEKEVLSKYLSLDIRDDKIVQALVSDKDYLLGAKHFISRVKWASSSVWKKNTWQNEEKK